MTETDRLKRESIVRQGERQTFRRACKGEALNLAAWVAILYAPAWAKVLAAFVVAGCTLARLWELVATQAAMESTMLGLNTEMLQAVARNAREKLR